MRKPAPPRSRPSFPARHEPIPQVSGAPADRPIRALYGPSNGGEKLMTTARPTVLLCDDSRALRMLAASQLEEAGFQAVGEAGNGNETPARYRALKPGLGLRDLVTPEREGRQALSNILAADPQAKVVILSSLGAQSDIEECLRAGARSYLQKPIDPEVMERVLREALA